MYLFFFIFKNIYHNDIKPANILIDIIDVENLDISFILADFGVSEKINNLFDENYQ